MGSSSADSLDRLAKRLKVVRRPSNTQMLRTIARRRRQDDPRLSGTAAWQSSAGAQNAAVWGGSTVSPETTRVLSLSRVRSFSPLERGGHERAVRWDDFTSEWVKVEDWERALQWRLACK